MKAAKLIKIALAVMVIVVPLSPVFGSVPGVAVGLGVSVGVSVGVEVGAGVRSAMEMLSARVWA